MKNLLNVGIWGGVIIALLLAWYWLRFYLKKPDVQALSQAGNCGGLRRALRYKLYLNDSGTGYIRSNAAIALGACGALDDLPQLAARLGESDERMVQCSAQAIFQIILRTTRQPLAMRAQSQEMIQLLQQRLVKIQGMVVGPLSEAARRCNMPDIVLQALGMAGGATAAALLIEVYKTSKNNNKRTVALQALVNSGDPSLLQVLSAGVADSSWEVRTLTAQMLAGTGLPQVCPALQKLLHDDHPKVVMAAVLGIVSYPQIQPQTDLLPLLGHRNGDIRLAVSAALAKLGDSSWGELIRGENDDLERLADSDDPRALAILLRGEMNIYVIRAIRKKDTVENRERLLAALQHTDSEVRATALEALTAWREPRIAKACQAWLQERENTDLVVAAIHSLILVLGRESIPILLAALQHTDSKVRATAFEALTAWREPRIANACQAWLQERENIDQGVAAIHALASVLGEESIPMLLESRSWADANTKIALAIIEALAPFGAHPLITKHLLLDLGNSEGQVRLAAARALENNGDDRWNKWWIKGDEEDMARLTLAKPIELFNILEHAYLNWSDNSKLLQHIANTGDDRFIPLLEPGLADKAISFRKMVADVLARLGKTKWQKEVQGDDDDYERLARKNHPEALKHLVYQLQGGKYDRFKAAETLIRLASNPHPEAVIISELSKIHALITAPHQDTHSDGSSRSSDCCHSDHTDSGIGLKFPVRPLA